MTMPLETDSAETKALLDRLVHAAYQRSPARFVMVLVAVTRIFAIVAGCACIYYVNLTMGLSGHLQLAFDVSAVSAILFAAIVTSWLAIRESRPLRRALRGISDQEHLSQWTLDLAVKNAVMLPGRMVKLESIIDPFITIIPICLMIRVGAHASFLIMAQVAVAGFLGLSCIILSTFFFTERCLSVVISDLTRRGAVLDQTGIPVSTLGQKMNTSFGITIAVTAMTIGGLAVQRSMMIAANPESVDFAVKSLGRHTVILTLAAIVIGLTFSSVISESISTRTRKLVSIMRKVQAGDFSLRVSPTGTDEIDTLARQFNQMVDALEDQDRELKQINLHLEELVFKRTNELRESLSQLREMDKMKTEFFSNVSHELRTPLMMILSPIAQALKSSSLSKENRNLLNVADINAQRLLKEINHILDFSALEAGQVELTLDEFSITDLVKRITFAATPMAVQRQLLLAHSHHLPNIRIVADENKIEGVLVNLIANAIKFTPPQGKISVRISSATGGERCRISVTDTGIGISAEDQQRLFCRFTQLDGSASRSYAGTGLGLAISKEYIERHQGTIGVESEPGVGSCFWFEIPVAQRIDPTIELPDLNRGEPEFAPTPRVRDNVLHQSHGPVSANRFADLIECEIETGPEAQTTIGPTILIVDDLPEVRHLLKKILCEEYCIISANDGREGLKLVHEQQPDLIISDVMMPHISGIDLCKALKADPATAAIPFMLLTARAGSSMKVDGLDCGADDYVTKPFREAELLARIRSLLRLRQLHSDLESRNSDLENTLTELNRLQEQMVRSEKMTSLGQLVAGLAHEINNSVNIVHNGLPALTAKLEKIERCVGALQIEEDLSATFHSVRRLTSAISEGTSRTARIVRDMKVFSHPGTTHEIEIDVAETIARSLNLVRLEKHPSLKIECLIGDLPKLRGHYSQLDQVLVNILGNAVDALRGRGTVRTSHIGSDNDTSGLASDSGVDDPRGVIRIEAHASEQCVTISIRDDGPGMDELTRKRIFDPFFTTKEPGHGTGLGLSLSYRIIEQSGGQLSCLSTPGNGAEFVIALPVHARESKHKQRKLAASGAS